MIASHRAAVVGEANTPLGLRFAAFAADLTWNDLSDDVRDATALVTADTIGAILAGSVEQEVRLLTSAVATADGATILADGMPKADPTWAAFINATAGTTNELDEWHPPTGHPAIHVIPPVLALAEVRRLGWHEALTAIVVGYETFARVAMGTSLRKGFHPHGTIGSIAAALACAKLLHLPADRIGHAMNIAASMLPATPYASCYQGVTVRNAFAGEGARLGVTAALLAECGFTADPGEVGAALQRLASRTALAAANPLSDGSFRIMHSSTKFHAACGLSLAALDAVADAVGQQRFAPGAVRHVRLVVNKRVMPMDIKNPPNRLAAKFSLPYAVAVLLLRGQSGYSAYSEELLADPDVKDLQTRIEVVSEGATGVGEARVEVRTSNAILEGVCSAPRGSPGNRTSPVEVLAKVEALASVALREAELRAVVSKLVHVGSLDEGVAETWASVVRTSEVR